MKQYIIDYFNNEKLGATIGLALGVILLVAAFLLWRNPAASAQRGIAVSLMIGGLFLSIATTATIIHNNKRISQTQTSTLHNDQQWQQQEIARMEHVLKFAYVSGLILFCTAFITGLVLFPLVAKPFLKGIAVGLLIFGLLGIGIELVSIKNNKAYYERIKSLKF